ncbi:MAG: TonB-dependent receptor [Bacteroidaceae bacterium]|nr:TonB-dependent receptor [Bacteroidaceae bacterium]
MLRYCLTLFLTLFAALSASAQRTLNGKITSADGKPLAGAIIQVYDGDKNVAFGNSRQDGSYKLTIPEANTKRKLTVNVRKLNYANRILDLPAGQTTLDAVLSPGEESLREVIVKAPAVEQSGDTLRFFMGQFATGTDVSLEDGLKRIPGIKVSESGAISYMGRDISQFYIEGLNLLGGRYNLATRNIPVDKVTGVEVLRHHQHNKVDKNELTADVALNIRLSEKAKIKPFGTYELRAGLEDEKRPLYAASGTAMLFRKTFQLLTTLKLGNEGRMGVDETRSHFGAISWNSGTEQALPLIAGGRPPFAEYLYKKQSNEMFSANALQKLTEDNQLKVNANYTHERSDYGYAIASKYQLGDELYETNEQLDYLHKKHKATMDVEYRSNKDLRLIENTFSLYGQFADAEGDAAINSDRYRQVQDQDVLGVRNSFSLVKKQKKWKWRLKSEMQYSETPEGALDIRLGEEQLALQKARSRMFKTRERFYTGYEVLPGLTLALPVTFTLNAGSLQTDLERKQDPAGNDLAGWDMEMNVAPSMDYQTADRRFRVAVDVPLKFLRNDYENRLADRRMKFNRCFADASMFFHFILNASSNFEGRTDWWHSYGDYFSLLGNPIQTDYRTLQTRSGQFGTGRTWRSRLAYQWQLPLSFWSFHTSVSYTRNFSNTMRGQDMSGNDLSLTEQMRENTSNNVFVDVELSKYLLSAKTNLVAGGHYTRSNAEMFSSGKPTTVYGSGYGAYLNVRTNPIEQFEAVYRVEGEQTRQHTAEQRSRHTNYSQRLTLTYIPIKSLNLRASGEWRYTTLMDGDHKTSLLLDARAEYKISKKKIRLRLEMNNLLNKKSYNYTVYSGLNSYTYDYRMRGRELLFSIIWM